MHFRLIEQQLTKALSDSYYSNLNEKCKICWSISNGFQNGIASCESCKKFFKQSYLKPKIYVCYSRRKCHMNPIQLKNCKLCRWITCLRSGLICKRNDFKRNELALSVKNVVKKVLKEGTRENFNLSLSYLLKLNKIDRLNLTQSEKIPPKTFLSDNFTKSTNENQFVVLSLLRDKSFQLYREHTQEFESHRQRATRIVDSGLQTQIINLNNDFKEYLNERMFNILQNHANMMLDFIRDLPGFQRINKNDSQFILSEHFFTIFGFRTLDLFLDNDYFYMLDENIQMNKQVIGMIVEEKVLEKIFEFYFNIKALNLTDQELSLLLPYFLSSINENIEDKDLFKEINEYYRRALYYEFNLNKRNSQFIENFAQAVCWVPRINRLCHDINLGQCGFHI